MNCRKTASIAVLLLSSVLWTLPATAQAPNPLFTGVWFGFDPNDGSPGFIGVNSQFDVVFIDVNATGGCSKAGGGVYLGVLDSKDVEAITGAGLPDENVLKGPMDGVCQGNKEVIDIFFFTRYDPKTEEIEFRNAAFFRRVANVDADIWVSGAREMKTVSVSGWVFFNTVINWPPVFAALPGQGADCTDPLPPEIHASGSAPGAQLANCNLAFLDLEGIDLTGADLRGADLRVVRLHQANLSRADLTGADLTGVFWDNTICPDLTTSALPDGDGGTCLRNLTPAP